MYRYSIPPTMIPGYTLSEVEKRSDLYYPPSHVCEDANLSTAGYTTLEKIISLRQDKRLRSPFRTICRK